MVVKLIFYKLKTFQFFRTELVFHFLATIAEITALYVFLSFIHDQSIASYSQEVVLALGYHRVLIGFSRTFYLNQILSLPRNYRMGTLDKYFLAPINSKLYYCMSDISIQDILHIIFGLVLIGVGLVGYEISSILLILLSLILSNVLLFNLFLFFASALASKINPGPLNAVFTNVFSLSQFKPTLFPSLLTAMFTYLLPVSFLVWGPVQMVNEFSVIAFCIFILITIFSYVVCQASWGRLEKTYSSAN